MEVHHDPRRQQCSGQTVLLLPDGLQAQPHRTQYKGQRKNRPHQTGIGHGLQQVIVGILGFILEALDGAGQVLRGAQAPAQQRRGGENFPRILIKLHAQSETVAHTQEQTVGNKRGSKG